MHSRYNIPAPSRALRRMDAKRDGGRSLIDRAAASAKVYFKTIRLEKILRLSLVARTVNRHRWVGRVDQGAREKPL
jgi:hypothetical protein